MLLTKSMVAVLFFRTGLIYIPSSKFKTTTLSKVTEAWQYSNIVFILYMCQASLYTEFQLPITFCKFDIYYNLQSHSSITTLMNCVYIKMS